MGRGAQGAVSEVQGWTGRSARSRKRALTWDMCCGLIHRDFQWPRRGGHKAKHSEMTGKSWRVGAFMQAGTEDPGAQAALSLILSDLLVISKSKQNSQATSDRYFRTFWGGHQRVRESCPRFRMRPTTYFVTARAAQAAGL